eukprot:TRINITY_DN19445_c0_g1_i1.p3 TRINITY_DN19445_c0_g1~~TRINITY_DN19445_c0_g1_i1.p3  ORF type:complete len:253 (-),score=61.38 TRINITY_DN19445_c0_g1_i1:226-984(-)
MANVQALFDEAIDKVFARWTMMNLATEQGWGGRDSRSKRDTLQAEVLEYLANGAKKKRPPSHEHPGDVEDLAHFIYLRVDELFNTETDDNSDMEIATLCLRLFSTCHAGDVSFAQQLIQACESAPQVDLSKCQGMERIEYATDEDQLIDAMESMGMDVEDGGAADGADNCDDGMAFSGPSLVSAMPGAATALLAQEVQPAQTGGYPSGPAPAEEVKPARAPVENTIDDDGFECIVKGSRRRGPGGNSGGNMF